MPRNKLRGPSWTGSPAVRSAWALPSAKNGNASVRPKERPVGERPLYGCQTIENVGLFMRRDKRVVHGPATAELGCERIQRCELTGLPRLAVSTYVGAAKAISVRRKRERATRGITKRPRFREALLRKIGLAQQFPDRSLVADEVAEYRLHLQPALEAPEKVGKKRANEALTGWLIDEV